MQRVECRTSTAARSSSWLEKVETMSARQAVTAADLGIIQCRLNGRIAGPLCSQDVQVNSGVHPGSSDRESSGNQHSQAPDP